jgi:hypothetical protein
MGISIWVYIHQIVILEHEFRVLRGSMEALRQRLIEKPCDETSAQVKLELGLIVGHVRVLKAQASCLKEIGEQFDLAMIMSRIMWFLHGIDPALCNKAIDHVNQFIEDKKPEEEESEESEES